MPRFSKNKKKVIGGLLEEMGCSESMTDAILRGAQAETEKEAASATTEIHRQLLQDLKRQHEQGVRFSEADLQEFLGQDDVPTEFQELLKGGKVPPEPLGPSIAFESPTGWTSELVSSSLHIRKGRKLLGEVSVIDDFSFKKALHSNEVRDRLQKQNAVAVEEGWKTSPVQFGDSHGFKFRYIQTEPWWKRVQYLLEVPGGKVSVVLDGCGKDFDEAAFEDKLKTLRISPAV
jgi:hypothetical protein